MRSRSILAALVCAAVGLSHAAPTAEPDPKFAVSGLVGFGRIPSNFRESTGDTFGGAGSAIYIKRGSFKKTSNGTFTGTLIMQPDRGFNVITTIDYRTRQFVVDFSLQPYYGDADLSFSDAQETLSLKYRSTLLYTERDGKKPTGLEPLGVRAKDGRAGIQPEADPAMPIASASDNRLSIDAEGLAINPDGTWWTSDEAGPYIYKFNSGGFLLQTIQPPQAFLPLNNGSLNFTEAVDPQTGRAGNKGFEGLTISPTGDKLFALLQSATVQDGGSDKSTSRFTRMVGYDIPPANEELNIEPTLFGEWVVPLPVNSKQNTLAQSEFHYLTDTTFFVLSRDANGGGGSPSTSSYKQADLFDISGATNIRGTKFDNPKNPVFSNGVLDPSITPATYVPFVNFLDPVQLARFGLHNGNPTGSQLIDSKFESLALAPVNDPKFPNDYFLFTASDNDFISTQGFFDGVPFSGGEDIDTQILVFRVTLPNVAPGSIEQAISI
ncbi:hypothetical protein SISSUDRAFT_1069692 [Sistotremastrum suecicum HHB10207 ss-3]|uniref:Phytase-like domain-containing protein n=1 Tax=Sistotremastrum suecicum HHB10207 ss-3 TaxID=1314776 RepID=A0A166GKU7_9AGAM|nr:hypothetical protein SISSUDRAFT_1069692 [Sistotremastrum suecicum HHB10207 ss-3]